MTKTKTKTLKNNDGKSNEWGKTKDEIADNDNDINKDKDHTNTNPKANRKIKTNKIPHKGKYRGKDQTSNKQDQDKENNMTQQNFR